jgi:hypothetical protein
MIYQHYLELIEKLAELQYLIDHGRGIRSVSEGETALLYRAQNLLNARDVDELMWGEACKTMTYLINRTNRTPNGNKTPHEFFFRKKPSVGPPSSFRQFSIYPQTEGAARRNV